jgi:dTDP-glucose 4,6-dehydratase
MELSFLGDMKVLVTGATGFIGSWLAERLTRESNFVTILVRPNSPRRTCIQSFEDKLDIVYGDIRDRDIVGQIVQDKDIVFHLAAVTQVVSSMKDPTETFSVNFEGTINLLESLRRSDQDQMLIYASTDKVYGNPISLPITEDHPLLGESPYDASKIAAERAAYAYFKTYGLPVLISRSSNVYGGRDMNFLRAIPDFISSSILGNKISVRGSGKHVRDYMFVDDTIEAFLKMTVSATDFKGEVFNFGTGKPTSVAELATLVSRLAGIGYEILGRETPGEIDVQYVDYTKAKKKLDWEPQVELEEGLRRTLDWYSANRNLWTKFVEKNVLI